MTTKISFVYGDKDIANYVSNFMKHELGVTPLSRLTSTLGITERTYEFLEQQYDSVNDSPEEIIEEICQNKPDIIVIDPFDISIKYGDMCARTCKACGCESSPDDYNMKKYNHFLDCLAEIETPTIIATLATDDFLLEPIEERELPYVIISREFNKLANMIKEYTLTEEI